MKKLEDMTKEELYELVVDLICDGAEVQGCSECCFAERFGVDWGKCDED